MTTAVPLILFFEQIGQGDHLLVGGKNASLAEMYRHLSSQSIKTPDEGRDSSDKGVRIPYGFAITTHAYEAFIKFNNLINTLAVVSSEGQLIRDLITTGQFPDDLIIAIAQAYETLSSTY